MDAFISGLIFSQKKVSSVTQPGKLHRDNVLVRICDVYHEVNSNTDDMSG